MTYEEASKRFKIRLKALKLMQKNGLISYPLTSENVNNLSFLSNLWAKEEFIKLQMANMTFKKREKLSRTAGLNKIESYIQERYLGLSLDSEFSRNKSKMRLKHILKFQEIFD